MSIPIENQGRCRLRKKIRERFSATKKFCGAVLQDTWVVILVSEEFAEYKMDPYGTIEKQAQRYYFTIACIKAYTSFSLNKGILYLETRYGNLTKMLLEHFPARMLHPCNNDPDELRVLNAMFPNVQSECDDIIRVAKRQQWLGIWYDMEETWCNRSKKSWNWSKMPESFDNTYVCAVTLTSTRSGYTAEQHAIDLSQLLSDKGGTLKQQPTAYVGKGGKQNMIFALAMFESRCRVKVHDRVAVKWMNGIYRGIVTHINGEIAMVRYDDGHFGRESIHTMTIEKAAKKKVDETNETDETGLKENNYCIQCATEDGRKLRFKFFEDGLCSDCRKKCHENENECNGKCKDEKKVITQLNFVKKNTKVKKRCSECCTSDGRKLMNTFLEDGLCTDCRKQRYMELKTSGIAKPLRIKKRCHKCCTEDGRKLMCKFFEDGLCTDCRKL